MSMVGVVPNTEKDPQLQFTASVVDWLAGHGCTPVLDSQTAGRLGWPNHAANTQTLYSETEFLVVLGGDGTILKAAQNSALYGTPILGINLGTLGYLADVERSEAFTALEKAVAKQYTLENRMMLEAFFETEGTEPETFLALNDVCVAKEGICSGMITMELFINGQFIDQYRADGVILSTPTGSTAYNFSAGGPILKPDGEMIAITFICPHMLHARPYVVSAHDTVKIRLIDSAAGKAVSSVDGVLVTDGQNRRCAGAGDEIFIRRSRYYTSIMKTNTLSFYDILRRKML